LAAICFIGRSGIASANQPRGIATLEMMLRGQSAAQQAQDLPELHGILDRLIGYLENPSLSQAQHNEVNYKVRELERKIDELESRQNANRASQH
jgi:hypothetical protein